MTAEMYCTMLSHCRVYKTVILCTSQWNVWGKKVHLSVLWRR